MTDTVLQARKRSLPSSMFLVVLFLAVPPQLPLPTTTLMVILSSFVDASHSYYRLRVIRRTLASHELRGELERLEEPHTSKSY